MALKFQFRLMHLFLGVSVVSLLFVFRHSLPFLFIAVAANLFGLAVGLFVTHILKFPNDGSHEIEEDDENSDPETGR